MARKNSVIHNNPIPVSEALNTLFREVLKAVPLEDIIFVESLEGDAQRDFLKFCHETYNSQFFAQVVKNLVYTQVMFTAQEAVGAEQYYSGKNMVLGIKVVEDFFQRHANQYEQLTQPKEEFDPHASFDKPKI
jgi:hypothetical protein